MICNFCGAELNDTICNYCGNDNEILIVSEELFIKMQKSQRFVPSDFLGIKKGYLGSFYIDGKVKKVMILK